MLEDVMKAANLLFKLGLAVFEAIEAGDRSRTVGEIFDGVKSDMSELDRLELERFGPEVDADEHPTDDPATDLE